MKKTLILTVVWFLSSITMASSTTSIPFIILDTDMRSDCDDAGALAVLHALADNGECEILGVMASTTGSHVVATIGAINAYYGRPHLPVGLYTGEDLIGSDDYAPVVGDPSQFPSFVSNETAPDSTLLYRKLLHEAPDKSVTIVVVGSQSCINLLLKSDQDYEGDGSINKTGLDLIQEKVKKLVLMSAQFTEHDQAGFNEWLNIPAAQSVANNWPTPIVYSGGEIGTPIKTGARLTNPETNPVAMSYKLYRYTEGGPGVIGNRSSWDQTAVYYAIRGLKHDGQRIWDKVGPVSVSFTDEGLTVYEEAPEGKHYYLVQVIPVKETADIIETLMLQPPRNNAITDDKPLPEE